MNKPLFFASPPHQARDTVATIRYFLDKVFMDKVDGFGAATG
jgi:hypothetical protein